jgi:preprotein translocase subunit SecE
LKQIRWPNAQKLMMMMVVVVAVMVVTMKTKFVLFSY